MSPEGVTIRVGKIVPDLEDPIDRAVVDLQAGRDREKNFRILVERFYRPVQAFLAKRIFSADDCLDLTQETFLGLYTGLDGYRWDAPFASWLFCIAVNGYRKQCRRRARTGNPGMPADLPGGPQAAALENHELVAVDPEKTPLQEVLTKEQVERLREAIEELPPQMRQCLTLRLYHELKYKEIAESLEVSIETVKAHLFQARKKLREKLADDFEGINF